MIDIVKVMETCSACPSQWNLWDKDGNYYYVRYRWGELSINKNAVLGPEAKEILFKEIGDPLSGTMNLDELKEHTKEIFNFEK